MTRALLLFARSPEAEARSKGLPMCAGAALFSRIAHLWSEAAKSSGARLFISTDSARWTTVAPGAVILRQHGAAFGVRLADSVEQALSHGATALLVAGIDTPPPVPSMLEEAFLHLECGNAAAVIGPATDGGIYLLGFTHADRVLLEGIKPRRHDVVEHCRRFFSGSDLLVLPIASDLDSLRDALRLARSADALWTSLHPLLISLFGSGFLAPDARVPVAIEPKSHGSRAPPLVTT